ncbi:MAG: hypothetical protein RL653_742 [Pseudomonadota bacterium]|jgi:hypothetical protein
MGASNQRGQATVEQALIMPMMVFLVLGILQMGTMQQARLMTEYGAYRAARAGIVNGGDCTIMRNAATLALLPTFEDRVDDAVRAITASKLYLSTVNSQTGKVTQGLKSNYPGGLERVRVEVMNPRKGQLSSVFSSYGISGRELDWDDVRNSAVVEANLLTVRVTTFYELRIPFANLLIHSWYVGFSQLDNVTGGVLFASPQFKNTKMPATQVLEGQAVSLGKTDREKSDFKLIAGLAQARRYVIPMKATFNMRMQSNLLYQSGAGNGGVDDCAIDP